MLNAGLNDVQVQISFETLLVLKPMKIVPIQLKANSNEVDIGMTYKSSISFTLDTICPWTYLGLRRLGLALDQFRSAHPDAPVEFTLKFFPYQLYPGASKEGEDKFSWYKQSRYGDSDEKMTAYTTIMSAYGRGAGIDFKFGGIIANTLNAHRVIHVFQEKEGEEVARKIIEGEWKPREDQKPVAIGLMLMMISTLFIVFRR
jgi:hypothetical protein